VSLVLIDTAASIASRTNVRDDRDTPLLVRRETPQVKPLICPTAQARKLRQINATGKSPRARAHCGERMFFSPRQVRAAVSAYIKSARGSFELSVAFTKEESAETASETLLPDRPISPHPNLVTAAGLAALQRQLAEARDAYEAAQGIEDVNERRRQAAGPLRDARYFAERVRTAQVMPAPASTDTVAFGSTVTFSRPDGRIQTYRIVGEDEADPKMGSISFVSPVAKALLGKAVGDVVGSGSQELEITAIGG
jgi:transcription elongation GreA/GreB family factor